MEKSRWKLLLIVALLALWNCGKKESHELALTMHPQETDSWCWAASGEIIMDYLGKRVSQCSQANNAFGRNDCSCTQCSSSGGGASCAEGGWPEFFRYGFDYKRTNNRALSWDRLKEEILHNRPVAFSWHSKDFGGHMMVARGFFVDKKGRRFVEVLDPANLYEDNCEGSEYNILYEDYVGRDEYSHWDDFFDIRRR